MTTDTNDNLNAAIVEGGASGPFDLLLTDDDTSAQSLIANNPSFVASPSFHFANDSLVLYSVSTNIHNGLPNPLRDPVVIPDPTKDAYGKAAATILGSWPWGIETIPSATVVTEPNVAITQVAVEIGLYPYGFIPKSAICSAASGTETYPSGSYHYSYLPHGPHHYLAIKLEAVQIALARTPDQQTELTNFIMFLKGRGTTQGTDVLKRYCYQLPAKN